jgi:hypothetical protein
MAAELDKITQVTPVGSRVPFFVLPVVGINLSCDDMEPDRASLKAGWIVILATAAVVAVSKVRLSIRSSAGSHHPPGRTAAVGAIVAGAVAEPDQRSDRSAARGAAICLDGKCRRWPEGAREWHEQEEIKQAITNWRGVAPGLATAAG